MRYRAQDRLGVPIEVHTGIHGQVMPLRKDDEDVIVGNAAGDDADDKGHGTHATDAEADDASDGDSEHLMGVQLTM